MKLRILEIKAHARGKIYKIGADGKIVSIVLTFHALERTQREKHVVRVIYEYQGKIPVVITVYFSFAQRYFGGGGVYEDKILA